MTEAPAPRASATLASATLASAMIRRTLAAALLAVAVLFLFSPARHFAFISIDDDVFVYENPHIRGGLDAHGLRFALTADLTWSSPNVDYWQPVTVLSRLVDIELFGLDAGGHHLANVLYHAAGAVLLFLLLVRVLCEGRRREHAGSAACGPNEDWGVLVAAFLAAAAWALHPLSAGSVGWVTDRKTILSTLLLYAMLLVHVGSARRPFASWVAWVLPLAALACGAKATAVVFPALIFLVDRFVLATSWSRTGAHMLVAAPIALLILVNAVAAQGHAYGGMPITETIRHVPAALGWYLEAIVLPGDFACFYPYPDRPAVGLAGISALLVLAGTALTGLRTGIPAWGALAVGWMVVAPSPPILATHEAWATRFAYPAAAAWCFPLAALLARALGPTRSVRVHAAAIGLPFVVLGFLAYQTRAELAYWRDSTTLYARALEVTGLNAFIEGNLALLAIADGRADEAEFRLERMRAAGEGAVAAGRTNRHEPLRLVFLGVLRERQGREAEAVVLWTEAAERFPRSFEARSRLGAVELQEGRLPEAERWLSEALALRPGDPETENNLGVVHARRGDAAAALKRFEAAATWHPRPEEPAANMAQQLWSLGRPAHAMRWIERALAAANAAEYAGARAAVPTDLWILAAEIAQANGQDREAMLALGEAIERDSGHFEARFRRAALSLRMGALDAAAVDLAAAIALRPGDPRVLHILGILRLARGEPREALEAFAEAFPRHSAPVAPALGAAQASLDVGDEAGAWIWARKALQADSSSVEARRLLERLEGTTSGRR